MPLFNEQNIYAIASIKPKTTTSRAFSHFFWMVLSPIFAHQVQFEEFGGSSNSLETLEQSLGKFYRAVGPGALVGNEKGGFRGLADMVKIRFLGRDIWVICWDMEMMCSYDLYDFIFVSYCFIPYVVLICFDSFGILQCLAP